MRMQRVLKLGFTLLALACLLSLGAAERAMAGPVLPDSAASTKANPLWNLRVTGPVGAPVTVYPTNKGARIKNANGDEVRGSARLGAPFGTHTFSIPGLVNGKPTTDFEQTLGNPNDPLDPGTLQASVFTDGVMTENSLGNFLAANGYGPNNTNEFFMPDFFPVEGGTLTDVFFGVDMAALGTAGATFVGSHTFGDMITLTGSGTFDELPGYIFSSTPLVYAEGQGWTTVNPLAAGTQLEFVGFHAARAIPEPASLALLGVGALGVIGYSWRRKVRQSRPSGATA